MKKVFKIVLSFLLVICFNNNIYAADLNRIVYCSRTGSKYHYVKTCSDMKDPIEMTLAEAIEKGREPCKNCVRESSDYFIDVDDSTPHNENIMYLADTGVSKGWETSLGNEFRPYSDVARADMAAFIRRLAVHYDLLDASDWAPTENDLNTFIDVDRNVAHYEDILWLAHAGISNGWSDGTFRPYASVARCDMAAFIRRLASYSGVSDSSDWNYINDDLNVFSDINENSPHFNDVLWLAHSGISKGWDENDGSKTFRPLENVVRCDMAAFLNRFGDLVNE